MIARPDPIFRSIYCPKANLIIEIDGGQHYSEAGKGKDRARDDNE